LFNVKGCYDVNLYTTALDHAAIDDATKQRAEKIAREIESQGSSNLHILEERGHVVQDDFVDEDRFLRVLRKKPAVVLPPAAAATARRTGTDGSQKDNNELCGRRGQGHLDSFEKDNNNLTSNHYNTGQEINKVYHSPAIDQHRNGCFRTVSCRQSDTTTPSAEQQLPLLRIHLSQKHLQYPGME